MAAGVKEGDWVWTSPISFVASANCAVYCGARISFVDINYTTGLMCMEALKEKLRKARNDETLPTAIVVVHLKGASCDMKTINELSKDYGFKIIEDASHALGGTHEGQKVCSCSLSDIAVTSLHPVKIITSGEGGMIFTNNSDIAERLLMLRSHGITRNRNRYINEAAEPWEYEQQMLGYNYRMSDINAALGRSQLERIGEIVIERNRQANLYKKLFSDSNVQTTVVADGTISAWHLFTVQIKNSPKDTKSLYLEMRKRGYGVQVHYSPIHLQPFYRQMGFRNGDYPEAEKYSRETLSIPIYPGLKTSVQKDVVRIVKMYTE
jgi:dTDP-4-amino-4,6-dideoxygalactose transaminase